MSSNYHKSLMEMAQPATPEEKLGMLRREAARSMARIRGAAGILEKIDPMTLKGLPETIEPELLDRLIKMLAEASRELDEAIDVFTQHHS